MIRAATIILFTVLWIPVISCNPGHKKENKDQAIAESNKETNMEMPQNDHRISLGLNAMQKQHQLRNMRSHLEAVQNILALLSREKYEEASEVAFEKLGSTTEMKLMCSSFGNEKFENLGLSFHESADEMSEVFKTGDKNKSLRALSKTLNYCVQCHAAFRQ